jgi:uncharacterized protein (DUF433 family)
MHTVDGHLAQVYGGAVDYSGIITIEPGKRGGKPVIRGLRITVDDVLSYLAAGMSAEQIAADFPPLTSEDVLAVLAYAADRERRIATARG